LFGSIEQFADDARIFLFFETVFGFNFSHCFCAKNGDNFGLDMSSIDPLGVEDRLFRQYRIDETRKRGRKSLVKFVKVVKSAQIRRVNECKSEKK
jgi:hypothetical protein